MSDTPNIPLLAQTSAPGDEPPEAAFDRIVRDSIPPVTLGLGALYLVIAVSHLVVLPPDLNTPLAGVAAVSSLALFVLYGALKRRALPIQWAHPLGAAMALLVLFHDLLLLYFSDEPRQSTNLMLLIVGVAFFLLAWRWLALMIVITWGAWLLTIGQMPPSDDWVHYGFGLFSSTVLAGIFYVVRIRTLRHLEDLRWQEHQSRVALEAANALAHQNEERFRRFSEASFEGIVVHQQGILLDANQTAQEMFGYAGDSEMIGRSVLDFVGPESYETALAKIAAQDEQTYEIVGLKKDGTLFPLEVRTRNLSYQGRPVRFAALRDITERRQLEDALWASLERSASLLQVSRALVGSSDLHSFLQETVYKIADAMPADRVTLIMVDLEARTVEHTVTGGAMTGPEPDFQFDELVEGLTGWVLREQKPAFSPQGRPDPRESARVQERRQQSGVGDIIVVPLRGSGALQGTITVCNRPEQRLTPGDVEWLLVVANQIAPALENARLVESLRLSEEKFFKAFHASPVPMIISAMHDGRYIEVNKAFLEAVEYSREDVIGHTSTELGIWTSPAERARFIEVFREHGSVRDFETTYRKKSGGTGIILMSSEIVDFGGVPSLLTITTDITERKRIETEREQLIQELDAFAHTVAHDLKNPLSPILGYSQTLLHNMDRLAPPVRERALQTMARNAKQMANIIDELLLLANMRRSEVQNGPLDMAQIIENVRQRLAYMIEENQAEITLPDTWPQAVGYGPWVEEVWANYISNAIKYGGLPPQIELGASLQLDGTARFWVKDNGAGLSPEQQARLFTPFTRVHQAKVEGHGLGLSIVQRIVERLGGTVGVESAVGQGSTFYFMLPCASNDRA